MSKSKCGRCGQPVLARLSAGATSSCVAGSEFDALELHFQPTAAAVDVLLELASVDPEALVALTRIPSPRSYSAADAYELRLGVARRMLAAIEKGLEAHAGREAADSRNWGYVGDLAEVGSKLAEIMGALGVVEVA